MRRSVVQIRVQALYYTIHDVLLLNFLFASLYHNIYLMWLSWLLVYSCHCWQWKRTSFDLLLALPTSGWLHDDIRRIPIFFQNLLSLVCAPLRTREEPQPHRSRSSGNCKMIHISIIIINCSVFISRFCVVVMPLACLCPFLVILAVYCNVVHFDWCPLDCLDNLHLFGI